MGGSYRHEIGSLWDISNFLAVLDSRLGWHRMNEKFVVGVLQREANAGETGKIRSVVLPYLQRHNGIDIG